MGPHQSFVSLPRRTRTPSMTSYIRKGFYAAMAFVSFPSVSLLIQNAISYHGRPCKLDLPQDSTKSFYPSSPNRWKSIQHFLLSLSGYCPNSFWKQSSVHRFLRKQGRDAHCHCRRIYLPRCSAPCLGSCSKSSTMCGTSSAPKTNKTRRGC